MKIINRWKKQISFWLAAVLLLMMPGNVQAAGALKEPKNLGAHHAYAVMDANTGGVLLSDSLEEKIYPASTVKIMTGIVALEHMERETKIKVKENVVKNIPSGAAKYGLSVGKKYTLDCLLHILLLVSGADAAEVIANAVGGSTKKFVKMMNAKAAELGMTGSHFDNPIGLDIGDGFKKTYATAYDYCLLTKYAMQNEDFCEIVGKAHYQVKRVSGKSERNLTNTNRFYTIVEYDKSLYQVIGTKSGTTNAAGHVFIATAVDKKGHRVICAYFGKESTTQLFADIRSLFNKVFRAQKNGNISLGTAA